MPSGMPSLLLVARALPPPASAMGQILEEWGALYMGNYGTPISIFFPTQLLIPVSS